MPEPTITDYFGFGAEVVTDETIVSASSSSPALIIPFEALSAAGLGDSASMLDPDRVFAAILKIVREATLADTDEVSGVEIGSPRKSFVTRGNSLKLAFEYSVAIYLPDPTGGDLDPDLVV